MVKDVQVLGAFIDRLAQNGGLSRRMDPWAQSALMLPGNPDKVTGYLISG